MIAKPKLSDGTARQVPIPKVPEGYILKVGGVNYDNLLYDKKTFADTIAPVNINLGYELYYGYQKWDITGFDVELPASDNGSMDEFKFKNVKVREYKKSDGEFSFKGRDSLIKALNDRENDASLDVSIKESDYLGDEGYEIRIESDRISISANTDRGIYWGRVTLSHMISENDKSWECGILRDYPEYAVRGFVLDVARRPMSMDMLYRMLDTLSDNSNRSLAEIRSCFNKSHCNLGTSGSVSYNYDNCGILSFAGTEEEVLDILMMAEVDVKDIESEEGNVTVYVNPTDLYAAKDALEAEKGEMQFDVLEIQMLPNDYVTLDGDDKMLFQRLLSLLDECDDVQHVFHNVEGL